MTHHGTVDRAELDAFFARADDVLTDWHGSTDAMRARVPTTDDLEVIGGDSYYTQAWRLPPVIRPFRFDAEQMRAMARVVALSLESITASARIAGEQMKRLAESLAATGVVPDIPPPATDVRKRALWVRQHRNTGPASRVGLDGHFR